MTDIHNPTDWSDFDFLEFEAFVSKVENEGFTYAAEEYPPHFESAELRAIAADLGLLRTLYVENEDKVESWWLEVGGERACDLHNAHVDEERQRRKDAVVSDAPSGPAGGAVSAPQPTHGPHSAPDADEATHSHTGGPAAAPAAP